MKSLLISSHRRGSLINLWVRDEDNQKRQITISDFQPYFYVENPFGQFKGIYGETLSKVYTKDPSQVRRERENYAKTWESDIIFTRRALIDLDIYKGIEFPDNQQYVSQNDVKLCEVDIEPLILFLDIEVLQGEGFPTAEKAEQPVISFSFRTNRTNKNSKYFTYILQEGESKIEYEGENVIVYFESEKDLLYAFTEVIEKIQPDIITGWNIIDFDFLYLKNRFKRLDLQWLDERSFELFDMLQGYKKIFSQPSYALKRVAEIEEIDKKENIETFKQVVGYYETDIKRFAEYNRKDVEYIYEIDKKHSLIDYYLNFKWLVGLENIQKTTVNSILIDTLLLRIAKEKGICLPTKEKHEEREKYEGAYVMVEKAGLYRDTAVFDFKSYYPYLIISFNLSPEIKEGDTKEGIIPFLLRSMLTEKEKISDKMDKVFPETSEYKALKIRKEATKRVINAVYGVSAYTGFRLYKPEIAEKTTKYGREGIQHLISLEDKYGYKVLLADTDSIFAQMSFDKTRKLCDTLGDEIFDYFQKRYGIKVDLNLEFEKYIKTLLLTGVKKRYAMRISYNNGECDYIETKGFENIRTDQSIFTRSLLTNLFELILYDKDKKEIQKFVFDKLEEFPKRPLSEIGISRGISKPFSEYKANTPHVRGSIYSNAHLQTNFHSGDKIMMIWVKGVEGLPATNVICFNEDTDLSKYKILVDWERMKKVCILGKVESILDAIGISLDNNSKQTTLS